MGALLHPVGPEGSRTYWIRRGVVVAGAVLLVLGLGWLIWPKSGPVVAVPVDTSSASPTASAASGSPSAPSSVSPSPTGPTACDPTTTKVQVAGFRTVTLGSKQVLSVAITNTSATPCVLDLSSSTFVLKVVSGSDQIWSTADCTKWLPAKTTTLKAGAGYEFKVDWGLHRSRPGCTSVAKNLRAGTYVASGSYRESATGRFVMVLKKK